MNIVYNNVLSVEDYCKLRKSVGWRDISEARVQYALDKSDFIIAAVVDSNAVGMARLITDGTQVLIMDVVVHPDYQGKGIGRGLMEQIRQYILSIDFDQILVNLITRDQTGFYEKLGYKKLKDFQAEGMRLWLNGM
ncbi:MAG: GNAT family N-acetyltransferase [Oscillospiraceae bacterium]|nr:GNAT family N-acetyltransferase [Oscillospiraceae bacterium]